MLETMFPHVKLERKTTPKKFVKTNEGIQRCVTFRSANVVKPLISMQKVHIRNIRDGTVIKLDVSNDVYTMDMWICLDETGPVFRWEEVAPIIMLQSRRVRISPEGQSSLWITSSRSAISEKSITCVAVNEDRHQNIMSSVALKKGVEEPWTIKRVVKFIDLLVYRELTLKGDAEPAIIAFRNRVAAMCKAEVTTEDAVKGDKESNGLIENAIMLLRGIIRTVKCHTESRTQEQLNDDSLVMPWLVEHAGCILSRCLKKDRDGKTPFERLHGKKPTQEFVPFGEKVLARKNTTGPRNRMNPRCQYGVWLGMRNNSAECFIGNADGVFRAREIRRLEPQDRWDTEAIINVIGVLWRMTDGRWTVDRPEAQVDPFPIFSLPFEGARVQRERITKQDINEFGATIGCPRLQMQSGTTKKLKHAQIVAECELRSDSELLRMEQKGWIEEMR